MKRSALSAMTGIDQHTLAELYYERTKSIRFETIEKICHALDCRVSDLMEYIPDPS